MIHKLGAHLSIAKGISHTLSRANSIGGTSLQIFSSSPRTWSKGSFDSNRMHEFKQLKKRFKIDPIYFHAMYLINLADSGIVGKKSIEALIHELSLASELGIVGSVVHTGSFKSKSPTLNCSDEKNFPQLLINIKDVLNNSPKNAMLILENAGNRKIGQTIDQLGQIIQDANNTRIRVCLDTCHLHAAGYDLRSLQQFELFLDQFDVKIGLSKLEVVHLNDSKDPFGSLRDRHENIGNGFVGIEVFRNFLNNKRTRHLPFIIETPGFDNNGPDKKNIDILKKLIKET